MEREDNKKVQTQFVQTLHDPDRAGLYRGMRRIGAFNKLFREEGERGTHLVITYSCNGDDARAKGGLIKLLRAYNVPYEDKFKQGSVEVSNGKGKRPQLMKGSAIFIKNADFLALVERIGSPEDDPTLDVWVKDKIAALQAQSDQVVNSPDKQPDKKRER